MLDRAVGVMCGRRTVAVGWFAALMVVGLLVVPGAASAATVTFSYTGGAQRFVVPQHVHMLHVDAFGAQGGEVMGGGAGGKGGSASARIPVHPGQKLAVYVGGAGLSSASWAICPFCWDYFDGGFDGGGGGAGSGGGASDVRRGGDALSDRVLVAGGGGGGGEWRDGGAGGGPTGGSADSAGLDAPGQPAGGGTQSAGGGDGGGHWDIDGMSDTHWGDPGQLGVGGNAYSNTSGGGGGGYYGGGGDGAFGGGGGGSSWAEPKARGFVTRSGVNSGNGVVRVSYAVVDRYPAALALIRLLRPAHARELSAEVRAAHRLWSHDRSPCVSLHSALGVAGMGLPRSREIVVALFKLGRGCGLGKVRQSVQLTGLHQVVLVGGAPQLVRVLARATSGLAVRLSADGDCRFASGELLLSRAGRCEVRARQLGNRYFAAAVRSGTFTITLRAAKTTLSVGCASPTFAGSPLSVSGRLQPAPSGARITITYSAAGQPAVSHVVGVGAAGVFTDGSFIPEQQGTYTIRGSYAGTSLFQGASAVCSYTPAPPRGTLVGVSCPPANYAGNPIDVSGYLNPYPAGAELTISYATPGQPVITHLVTVDALGRFSDSSGTPDRDATYTITAAYGGGPGCQAASGSCSYTPAPHSAETLSLKCPQGTLQTSQPIPVSGSLSPAVSGATITISYTAQNGTTTTDTVTTDASGDYQDSATTVQSATYTITAHYAGDASHQAATSPTCQIITS